MALRNIHSPFVWGADGQPMTPEEVARLREIQAAKQAKGIDFSPVASPLQGLARVANSLVDSWNRGQIDKAATAGRDSADSDFASLTTPFFAGPGGARLTAEEIAQRRETAAALDQHGNPAFNNAGWLGAIGKGLEGAYSGYQNSTARDAEAAGQKSANDAFAPLASMFGGSAAANGTSSFPAAPYTTGAPGGGATTGGTASAPDMSGNAIYSDFMGEVGKSITNPNALAAVAATGKHESGFSPGNSFRQWSDPSQSGQAGNAGGILSWRAERLANLRKFASAAGDDPNRISPATQAKFFLQENPALIAQLNAAKSPEEAQRLMNGAWRFAGYDKPGGEAGARIATARSFAGQFQGGGDSTASPIARIAASLDLPDTAPTPYAASLFSKVAAALASQQQRDLSLEAFNGKWSGARTPEIDASQAIPSPNYGGDYPPELTAANVASLDPSIGMGSARAPLPDPRIATSTSMRANPDPSMSVGPQGYDAQNSVPSPMDGVSPETSARMLSLGAQQRGLLALPEQAPVPTTAPAGIDGIHPGIVDNLSGQEAPNPQHLQIASALMSPQALGPAQSLAPLDADPAHLKVAQALSERSPLSGNADVSMPAQSASPIDSVSMGALMQAASNPWLNPQQRGLVNMLIQQKMQAADPLRQLELQKTQIEMDRLQHPVLTPADQIAREKFDWEKSHYGDTNDTKDYAAYAQDEIAAGRKPLSRIDYQLALRKSGATSVTVNGEPGDGALRKSLDENTGKLWSQYQATGAQSSSMVQDLDALDQLIKVAPQGPITGRLAEMYPGFSSSADAFQSIVKRVAPSLRVPGSGSQSDIEYDGFLKSMPALRNLPEANAAISGMMRTKARINMQRSEIIDAYGRGDKTAGQARTEIANIDKQSIMTPDLQKLFDGVGAGTGGDQSAPASVPRGAVDMLRSNPSLAPKFDQKYGAGAAKRILGGQ